MKNIFGDQIQAKSVEITREEAGGLVAGELIMRISANRSNAERRDVWGTFGFRKKSKAALTEYENRTKMTAVAR
jgi:hypothetical protein